MGVHVQSNYASHTREVHIVSYDNEANWRLVFWVSIMWFMVYMCSNFTLNTVVPPLCIYNYASCLCSATRTLVNFTLSENIPVPKLKVVSCLLSSSSTSSEMMQSRQMHVVCRNSILRIFTVLISSSCT